MAGSSQNSVNNTCVDEFTCNNLTFSGNTIDNSNTSHMYFYPSDGKETIIDTSTAGKAMKLHIQNTRNVGGSDGARARTGAGGASGGDAFLLFTNNVTDWSIGVDNTNSDKFVFSQNSTLGTNDAIQINTSTYEVRYPLTTAFSAFLSSPVADVTGNGMVYKPICNNTNFNQGSDYSTVTAILTASVSGKFQLEGCAFLTDISTSNSILCRITTSNKTFDASHRTGGSIDTALHRLPVYIASLCEMDAADTAYLRVYSNGEGANDNDLYGNTTHPYTFFTGNLEA